MGSGRRLRAATVGVSLLGLAVSGLVFPASATAVSARVVGSAPPVQIATGPVAATSATRWHQIAGTCTRNAGGLVCAAVDRTTKRDPDGRVVSRSYRARLALVPAPGRTLTPTLWGDFDTRSGSLDRPICVGRCPGTRQRSVLVKPLDGPRMVGFRYLTRVGAGRSAASDVYVGFSRVADTLTCRNTPAGRVCVKLAGQAFGYRAKAHLRLSASMSVRPVPGGWLGPMVLRLAAGRTTLAQHSHCTSACPIKRAAWADSMTMHVVPFYGTDAIFVATSVSAPGARRLLIVG